MSFISHLQDRNLKGPKKTKHPVSVGFSPATWGTAFNTYTDGSEEDKNIRDFGLFLYQRLEKVRDALRQLESQTPLISAVDVLVSVVSNLNEGALRLQDEAMQARIHRRQISMEEIGYARSIKSRSGGHYTTQEALEGIIDASRHVLRGAARDNKGYGSRQPAAPIWPADMSLQQAIQVAQYYDSFESQWQGALWMGATFSHNNRENVYSLSEEDNILSQESIVDLVRRNGKYQRDIDAVKKRELASSTMDELIISVAADNVLSVMRFGDFPEASQKLFLSLAYQRYALTEGNSAALLKESHGTVKGLTVRKAFDALMQLCHIAIQCFVGAKNCEKGSLSYKESFIIKFSEKNLEEALSEALKISGKQASELIAYFTLETTSKDQSMWLRPILRHPDGLMILWYPLFGFHPMRILASWAKEAEYLEVTHAKRGREFEKEVLGNLLKASVGSPFKNRDKPFALGPGIKVSDSSVGDIDVLLIFGDTAYVLECINVMHPATAHECWSVATELKEKIEQALRKRDYLQKNPVVLNDLIENSEFHFVHREIKNIVGLVVSNSYFFEGANEVEPYFAHIDTLFNVILGGGVQFGDLAADDSEITYQVDSFGNDFPLGASLTRAIAKSVKAEFHKACTEVASYPMPALHQAEPIGIYRKWSYSPVTPGTLKQVLESCSFANEIIEMGSEARQA